MDSLGEDDFINMATYSEKLRDPRWQRMRLEILQRDSWKCTRCGNTENTLHVHHIKYCGKDPWDTPVEFLKTLCEFCHSLEESMKSSVPDLLEMFKKQGWSNEQVYYLRDHLESMSGSIEDTLECLYGLCNLNGEFEELLSRVKDSFPENNG